MERVGAGPRAAPQGGSAVCLSGHAAAMRGCPRVAQRRPRRGPPGRQRRLLYAGARRRLYFDPARARAAIVTRGGLCPRLNHVIRSVTRELRRSYGVASATGIRGSYQGLDPRRGRPPGRAGRGPGRGHPPRRRHAARHLARAGGHGRPGRLPDRPAHRHALYRRRRRHAARRARAVRGGARAATRRPWAASRRRWTTTCASSRAPSASAPPSPRRCASSPARAHRGPRQAEGCGRDGGAAPGAQRDSPRRPLRGRRRPLGAAHVAGLLPPEAGAASVAAAFSRDSRRRSASGLPAGATGGASGAVLWVGLMTPCMTTPHQFNPSSSLSEAAMPYARGLAKNSAASLGMPSTRPNSEKAKNGTNATIIISTRAPTS